MVHGLDWAAASTETVRGLVSSAWHKVDTGYTLDVTLSFGSTANPTSGGLEVGSGTHHFVVKEQD